MTILRESRAVRANKKIKPKERVRDKSIFFKKILKEKVIARNKDTKKGVIWLKFACVKVSG